MEKTIETMYNGELKLVKERGRLELRTPEGSVYSREVKGSRFSGGYWDHLALVPNKEEARKTLILGLGCGTLAQVMKNMHGDIEIHGTDLDKDIIDIGEKKFNLEKNTDQIYTKEAEKFLEDTEEKYTYIVVDCFKGKKVPNRIKSTEFMKKAKERLKPGGLITFNVMLPYEAREIKKNLEKVMNKVEEKKIKNISNTLLTGRRR